MNFKHEYKRKIDKIDDYISKYIDDNYSSCAYPIKDAIKYSVLNGGKRLRSILCLEICNMFSAQKDISMPFACAIEFIHAYSLVHDDLPEMDNATYRRGALCCHKKFGNDIGILCGDALLNMSMEVMSENSDDLSKIKAMRVISHLSGANGMINGQVIDLTVAKSKDCDYDTLIKLIENKTMALIKASIISGALIAKCDEETLKKLDVYAYNLGLAFQIRDDFEDINQDADSNTFCPNFVNILGETKAKLLLSKCVKTSYDIISKYPESEFLCQFHKYLFPDII